MALKSITPTPVRVAWDRRRARPAAVQLGARRLQVTDVQAIRDETAAYPADRGPRITFLLATDAGQASLVYDGLRRRWYVEALDPAA
ncbi:MAG TPA: hypothetical protein VFH63_04925 [candidate division Zixibacteria bacterium]|nr:hypothetical protein [candidate division Zixibacteria bacterium]